MTDTVVFDLGNVLVDYNWNVLLQEFNFSDTVYRAVADAVFLSDTWQLGDAGVIGAADWLDCFIQNAPEYEREIRMVYARLSGCIRNVTYTEALLAHFRARGYRMYYLSNYSEGLYEMTKEQLSFIRDFDGGVFSYKEKCLKPEEKIYKLLQTRYNIEPDNTIFFDDRLENVEAAQKLGFHAVLFTPDVVKEYLG